MDIPNKIDHKLDFKSSTHQQISQLLGKVDTFKGSWSTLEQIQGTYLLELKRIATIESIGSSTRIEGATLTDDEIEKLLQPMEINKLENREEQEVVGYHEALEIILENYEEIPLSVNYIHQLHGFLLKHSHKDQNHKGRYKRLSNQVVANYPDGSQRTIFRTTEPHLTGSEMEALIFWTEERLEKNDLHTLVIVATFIYEFLSIHPYQDGNGRLSRLLTTLLLMRLGYQFVQYVSFEHVIESRKEDYYRALMDGQKNRYNETERIEKWVVFFLKSLIELTQRLETKYSTFKNMKSVLNERQRQIVTFIQVVGPSQIGEIHSGLAKYSRNTLKKDLIYLVKEKTLIRIGKGRSVRYHLKED